MPHSSFKLIPGVDQNKTPALNEAAISFSQLVRFIADRTLGGLIQKLGGWSKFITTPINSIVRALWAWEDTNSNAYLAAGAEGQAPVTVTGASGTGSTATLTFAGPINFKVGTGITVTGINNTVTGASGTGTTATVTFSGGITFPVGTSVTISGINPSGYNGTYLITASSSGSVSFSNVTTGTYVSGGVISGQGGYNGTFSVTASTSTSVSYANTTTYTYVSGGSIAGLGGALTDVKNGNPVDITPEIITVSVQVKATTTSGSNAVTITDTGRNVTAYDVVNIETQISVGGLILFGVYQCYPQDANTYIIYTYDANGNPMNATSSVTTGGVVAAFTTTSGSNFVSVYLPNNGFQVGDTYSVLVPTFVGGLTIYGNYFVSSISISDPLNTFTIAASASALSTATVSQNGGNAFYLYYVGKGPLPAGTGFGIGAFGSGGFGTGTAPVATVGTAINAVDWTLDNWGEILISCPLGGGIYQWDPIVSSQIAQIIPNAPPVNQGMFVAMPQRQIVAWGSTNTGIVDPLLLTWCDVNNFNQWQALITNQAGSFRIPKGSKIVQCIQGPQQGLVWTDLGIWSMQYVGPPYVYQFNEIGTGCGLIGRKAAGSVNGNVYWMGQSQFFMLSGGGVTPIRCPVWDVIFQDLDTTNLDKIRFAANSRFGEVAWHYPTTSNGGEINAYVKYNYVLDQWDFGTNTTQNPYVARTAWINESVLGPPIGAGTNTYLYQHETSTDADGTAMVSSFQTGYFVLSEADWMMFVDQIWPDMKWGYYGGTQGANVQITFFTAFYPGQTPSQYGPYTMTEATTYITPRFRGRLVSILIESSDIGSFWRLGNIRYRYQQDGKY